MRAGVALQKRIYNEKKKVNAAYKLTLGNLVDTVFVGATGFGFQTAFPPTNCGYGGVPQDNSMMNVLMGRILTKDLPPESQLMLAAFQANQQAVNLNAAHRWDITNKVANTFDVIRQQNNISEQSKAIETSVDVAGKNLANQLSPQPTQRQPNNVFLQGATSVSLVPAPFQMGAQVGMSPPMGHIGTQPAQVLPGCVVQQSYGVAPASPATIQTSMQAYFQAMMQKAQNDIEKREANLRLQKNLEAIRMAERRNAFEQRQLSDRLQAELIQKAWEHNGSTQEGNDDDDDDDSSDD